jgi:HlyD family secretion protein
MTSRLPNTHERRRGFSTRGLLVALAVALALPALGFALWPKLSWSTADAGPMMHHVARGDFVHEITDRGNVESANNVEIRCDVKSKNAAGTTILEIVPEGTTVKSGDVLVKLDSSALENDRTSQLIVCNNSVAASIQAQKVYETAVIAKREYLEGQYKQTEQTTQNEIFVAQEDLSRAEEYVLYSKRLAAKGYVTQQQLKADQFAVDKARNALDIARTKLDVLRKFTQEKMTVQLDADIKTAEAKLKAQEASHKLDLAQLALIESQIENCIIKAPQDGQAVYANVIGWRGTKELIIAAGELARERQVLIRLPDPKRMQVVAKINEAKVALVSRGMSATIRLDAFPDLELRGTVERVDEFPVPVSFSGSSVKEYETVVRIDEPAPGLRPGLTAEVRIRVEHLPDVIQAPVPAVFEHGEKYYCITHENGRFSAREVTIGSTNDKTVTIRNGLSEGERIVLNTAAYRDKVKLPALPTESQQAAARARNRQNTPAAKIVQASPPIGGQPQKPASPVEMADRMFRQFDKDGNGKLQLKDVPEKLRSLFRAADADGDGVIDRVEWAAAAGRPAKEGGVVPKPGARL